MPAVSHIDQELENKILSHLKTAVSIETRSEQRTFQNRSDQSLRFLNSAYDHYANALANERQQDPVTVRKVICSLLKCQVDILEDYASINLDDLTQDLQKDISNTQDSLGIILCAYV